MNNKIRRYFIIMLCLLAGIAGSVSASHIVGGEMTYRCLGSEGGNLVRYEIQLSIYQDCINGITDPIDQDVPAYLGIYDNASQLRVVDEKNLAASSVTVVPPNFSNNCVNNPPATCLRKVVFTRQYLLPINASGYTVTYQRCCRNETVINIADPGNTGATYFCTIPAYSGGSCNNSATFNNFPPQIICVNNPLFYDHAATDPDGDSLSYEFCASYAGGSINDAKPPPPPTMPGTPSVVYQGFYSPAIPMTGAPQIQIDPQTGMISGTPNLMGRYVVTVCCHEWRNGVIINTLKREFQFVVTNCSRAVVANIPQFSDEFNTYIVDCKDYLVKFLNESSNGFAYHWDFGDGSTSSDEEPVHTYGDTGTYVVKLVVNRGSTCPDSISRFVKIYPTHHTGLDFEGLQCPKTPITFIDSTQTTFGPVNRWFWTFGDGQSSADQNPVHIYDRGGDYTVTLISSNVKGCIDTTVQAVTIENFVPYAGNDTIIVKGEIINFRASGGVSYLWTPPINLTNPETSTPVGFYPYIGRFGYNVHIISSFGCQGSDSINVWVVDQGSLFVPSAFTPNGDGLNDFLKPFAVGYSKVNFFGVFNRWGERVFSSGDFSKGWDGRYKDKLAPMDNYYWLLKVTNKDGGDEMHKGDVTLIR